MQELKAFTVRIPADVWTYMRVTSFEQETTMTEILLRALELHKEKYSKKRKKSID